MRVSEDPVLGYEGNGESIEPMVSEDGSTVVFRSSARNLESRAADNNEHEDIHVYSLERDLLRRVSLNDRNDQADRTS